MVCWGHQKVNPTVTGILLCFISCRALVPRTTSPARYHLNWYLWFCFRNTVALGDGSLPPHPSSHPLPCWLFCLHLSCFPPSYWANAASLLNSQMIRDLDKWFPVLERLPPSCWQEMPLDRIPCSLHTRDYFGLFWNSDLQACVC